MESNIEYHVTCIETGKTIVRSDYKKAIGDQKILTEFGYHTTMECYPSNPQRNETRN